MAVDPEFMFSNLGNGLVRVLRHDCTACPPGRFAHKGACVVCPVDTFGWADRTAMASAQACLRCSSGSGTMGSAGPPILLFSFVLSSPLLSLYPRCLTQLLVGRA